MVGPHLSPLLRTEGSLSRWRPTASALRPDGGRLLGGPPLWAADNQKGITPPPTDSPNPSDGGGGGDPKGGRPSARNPLRNGMLTLFFFAATGKRVRSEGR